MDEIKKYSVKIDYESQGSGVLLKVDEENCYLITAKHNFKVGEDESHNNVNTSSLEFDKIKISNPNNDKVCEIEKLIYEEKKLDLLIFKIKNNSSYIRNLPILQVVKDRHILSKKHFFYGFPNGEEKPSGKLTPLAFKVRKDEKHILSLRGDKPLYLDDEKGFSGSGVFIKEGSIEDEYSYYLTGIVTEVHEGQSLFETISLSEIIGKINLNLNPKIEVKEDVVDVGFSQNIYTRILNRNKDTYLVKRIFDELKEETSLALLKKNDSQRKKIIEFLDMDENQLLKVEKELADLYLLKAIIYHSDDNDKKTKYFDKAKKFNSRYKNYQLEKLDTINEEEVDEIKDSEFTDFQKAKLYFLEKQYNKVIEILSTECIEKLDNLEKIESYECLAKSCQNKKESDIEESIGYWSKIFPLLDETQIFEKAEIYYELSLLYEILNDKKEALDQVLDGLELLKDDKQNTFLEIKYKLEKQRKRLSDSNEEEKPNMILTELFKQNPERYMDDYLESLKNVDIEVTNRDILEEIRVLQQQIRDNKKKD
jgi:hypothetical protein